MLAHLSIGTADDRIDLISKKGAYWVRDWEPQAGGTDDVFAESALADYRQLRSYRYTTTNETLPLVVRASTQDMAIRRTQDLRRMLIIARDYWATDHQPDPVYVAVRATCETNMRYAIIHAGGLSKDGNPFKTPFTKRKPAMVDLPLVVERGPWQETAIGSGAAQSCGAMEAYDGRNLGNVDSSGVWEATDDQEVYIANKQNTANLTHLYVDDGAVFGANLMDAALPFNLLPAVPVAGDAVYFGIEVTLGSVDVDDAGPFCSLVFDIGTVGAGYDGVWEYPRVTGSVIAWARLYESSCEIQDNTNANGDHTGIAFDTAGVNSVHWQQPEDWRVDTVNGVDAWWIRYRVTNGGGNGPTQQSRDVYSIVWPYFEVRAADIGGDIPAYLRMRLYGESDCPDAGINDLAAVRAWIGLRKYDRGTNFRAYLNACDEQNPAGVWFRNDPFFASITNQADSICGQCAYGLGLSLGIGNESYLGYWRMPASIWSHYKGEFLAFARMYQIGGVAGDSRVKLRYGNLMADGVTVGPYNDTDWQEFEDLVDDELIEFGRITLPLTRVRPDDSIGGYLQVRVEAVQANWNMLLYDLVLIPVDEWAAMVWATPGGWSEHVSIGHDTLLDLDPISDPKELHTILATTGGTVADTWRRRVNAAGAWLHPNERQRFWFLTENQPGTVGQGQRSRHEFGMSVLLTRSQCYLSARGDR